MSLTDTAIRKAKPQIKPVRLFDEKGLYLELSPTGGKLWRWKYRYVGKEKRLALGIYPDVSLAEARKRRDEARTLLANGADPGVVRKAQKAAKLEHAANSFEAVAREWFAKHMTDKAQTHADKVIGRLEKDVFPWLGSRPIAEITPPEMLATLQRVEKRGAKETAHRLRGICGQVFGYAIRTGRANRNPSADLRGALTPVTVKHHAAIIDPVQVGELLRAFDGFAGTFIVQCALRLSPLLFVRPGELRKAKWADINFEGADWRYRATKTKTEHIASLSTQTLKILGDLHPLTGNGEYVFPGARSKDRPMSEAAVNAALRRLGYDTRNEITGHGFRAMARTILHERLGFKPEVIEHQLAHKVPDTLGTAYNRTKFLDERRTMMQAWADYLDKLKAGAEVIPLHGNAA